MSREKTTNGVEALRGFLFLDNFRLLAQVVQLRGIIVTTEYEDGEEESDDPYVFWEPILEYPVHILLTCLEVRILQNVCVKMLDKDW